MVKALFDTNILIDYLNKIAASKKELSRYDDKAISVITWMEIQVGTEPDEQDQVDKFLQKFKVLPIDETISARAVVLRKEYKNKLPDAIIWATAQVTNRILVTRNSKDFPKNEPGVRIPYVLS